jgi:predicted kinase
MLIDAGVGLDEECLVLCYTYRCPKTAKVLLSHGINPNMNWGGFESLLLMIRLSRHYRGFNEASEILLSQLEKTLKDYGAVKFWYKEDGCEKCEPKATMAILMGLQASGKSTFFTKVFKDKGYEHISLDILKTRRKEAERIQTCLDENRSCVIDNTNPTKADRARYITPGKHCDFRVVGYFLQSRLSDCLERNEKRERQVPKKGILATFKKIEMPSLDEGFDELNFVSIEDGEFRISKWIEDEI